MRSFKIHTRLSHDNNLNIVGVNGFVFKAEKHQNAKLLHFFIEEIYLCQMEKKLCLFHNRVGDICYFCHYFIFILKNSLIYLKQSQAKLQAVYCRFFSSFSFVYINEVNSCIHKCFFSALKLTLTTQMLTKRNSLIVSVLYDGVCAICIAHINNTHIQTLIHLMNNNNGVKIS